MKLRTITLALSLLSTSVLAQDYQIQADIDYVKIDSSDTFVLNGTYYFDRVSTKNTAWAEAAFMGRKSNVNASYVNFDGDANGLNLGGELFSNNFYGALNMSYIDVDGGSSDTTFSGQFGYFFADDWLVAITGNEENFSDTLGIRTKYIATLGNDQFVNLEASYDDGSDNFGACADYYWTAQSSIGITLSDADDFDFGVQAQHFFTPAVALRVGYVARDGDDAFTIGLSGRF